MNNELSDLYPITLKEYVASRSYLRLYEFEYCPLTFIYNTVMCSVAIYNGTETDSLIIEVHNKNTRFLQRDVQRLVNYVFETHQGVN